MSMCLLHKCLYSSRIFWGELVLTFFNGSGEGNSTNATENTEKYIYYYKSH